MKSGEDGNFSKASVALLTGGGDRPYVFGLVMALLPKIVCLDLIGSDDLNFPELYGNQGITFLNLRGNQCSNASFSDKVLRVSKYYTKLICYAATAKPQIFHILWNNKFQLIDRTLLMLYYRSLGKQIVLTVHNVNAGRRDFKDTLLNRVTLRIQYLLAHHIFVHTQRMMLELKQEFGVKEDRVTVIPFGINNAAPATCLTSSDARKRLNIPGHKKTILFFGNITPYKGLEYLIGAFKQITSRNSDYYLVIAGQPDNSTKYWATIEKSIHECANSDVLLRAKFILDDETELYFKAADVLVLPYRHIYQSGVLFLGYSFGLPVLAADVGSLRDDIVEGETGFIFRPEDSERLAMTIERYFSSDLYKDLARRRGVIRDYVEKRNSWNAVAEATIAVYARLLRVNQCGNSAGQEVQSSSLDAGDAS
jgi:glycosyltransferase involved in cell wall biosynthesis